MERKSEDKKDQKTFEEKIDFLVEESNGLKKERKRERILSKLDLLYTILITISFFSIGLLISQFQFLYYGSGLLVVLIGLVLTMVYSFFVGFKAMIKDSNEGRILSWCLLVANVFLWSVFYVPLPVLYFIGQQYLLKKEAIYLWAFYGLIFLAYSLIFLGQRIVTQKFANWAESKLSFYLDEKIDVWKKIKMKIFWHIMKIYLANVGVLVVLLFLTGFL